MIKTFKVEEYPLDICQTKILLTNTNILAIAGAGSGKTLTIIGKINYLIEYKNILPHEILVISFTNSSTNDLKKRIGYDVSIYTFHKLAMNILKMNNISYSLCSSKMLNFIIKEYLMTCSILEQKYILRFLKINYSYKKFTKSSEFFLFCNFVESFINLYQTLNFNKNMLFKIKFFQKEKCILLIIFKIYKFFLSEKQSSNLMDFDDLIISATKYVEHTHLPFKYIIIDEFQDSSFIRLNLIYEIYKHTNSKIIVVGDDWQSIYRFSGCDLSIFLNFQKTFPNVKRINLKNTYRNSQELINFASKFIQKNPNQLKKVLYSNKKNSIPIIFVPYKNKKSKLKKILNSLISKTDDVMILSRNNRDIYEYLDNDCLFNDNVLCYNEHKFKFLTIHKSKGLEAKYIIILNCNDEYLGFPNKIENNSITQKIFPNESYKFAEERRLFYVALTRCKITTYIMYHEKNPSKFVIELKKIIKKSKNKIVYFK